MKFLGKHSVNVQLFSAPSLQTAHLIRILFSFKFTFDKGSPSTMRYFQDKMLVLAMFKSYAVNVFAYFFGIIFLTASEYGQRCSYTAKIKLLFLSWNLLIATLTLMLQSTWKTFIDIYKFKRRKEQSSVTPYNYLADTKPSKIHVLQSKEIIRIYTEFLGRG
ncbi:hypothetical protein ACU8KH_01633 [Lachancea thermotolerans]